MMGDFPWLQAAGLQRLFDIYAKGGAELRAVGGCVRDSLLGLPVADIDLAANCAPETGMALLEQAGIKVVPTGLQHGTITAVIDHIPYEITSLRQDVDTDGRHAVVAWTDDWQTDAARRDFTINALYLDRQGQVHDWFGGLDDLPQRRVRFVGKADTRITEDYLRIMRFYRFSARFSGALDAEGHQACQRHQEGLTGISVERIWSEMKKLLVTAHVDPVLATMIDAGLFRVLFPALALQAVPVSWLPQQPLLRLSALAAAGDDITVLAGGLKMSGAEARLLRGYGDAAIRDAVVTAPDEQALRHMAWRYGPDIVAGHLYLIGRDEAPGIAAFAIPECPVQGRDLIKAGVAPGPDMGAILQQLQQAWAASDFTLQRDALLAMVNIP